MGDAYYASPIRLSHKGGLYHMSDNDFKSKFLFLLKSAFPEMRTNKAVTEAMINCPICGMEGRPDTGQHMYISLGDNNKPLMYNCFKDIRHSGLLTPKALEKLLEMVSYDGDTSILNELQIKIDACSNSTSNRIIKSDKYNVFVPLEKSNAINEQKRSYINNRLGISLSYEDLVQNKIILSLCNLMEANGIPYEKNEYTNFLNTYCIGFLRNDNSLVIMRNLYKDRDSLPKSLKSRYITYKLFGNSLTGYYVLPSVVDIQKHVVVCIAEGSFDILSVCYNMMHNKREGIIYASIGGNSYLKIIKYFLEVMGLVDIEFHIYIDTDIDGYVLPQLKKEVGEIWNVYIHSNLYEGKKDFGVPKNKIMEHVEKL